MAAKEVFMLIFLAAFIYVVGQHVYRMIKYGGFNAAMFDAPIAATIGEISEPYDEGGTAVVRIHRLAAGARCSNIVLELTHKSFLSYEISYIKLSEPSVRSLIAHLQRSLDDTIR